MSSSNIKLKRSAVAGKVPTTEQIDLGELALNTYDGIIYFKKTDNIGSSIVTIREVTDDNLAIDTTGFNYSSSNTLLSVLSDIDSALNALELNVLTKTNTTEYTPTLDFHPATKKYVDDLLATVQTDDIVYTAFTEGTDTRILSSAPLTKTLRYYVQALNEVTGEIYASEINILYDNTDIFVSEHSIIDTSDPGPMINFSAILLGSEITLTATPQTSDRITIKFIRNILNDFPEIGLSETTSPTVISSANAATTRFITYEIVAQNTTNDEFEKSNIVMIYDDSDIYFTEKNVIFTGANPLATYTLAKNGDRIDLKSTTPTSQQHLFRVARIHQSTVFTDVTTTSTSTSEIYSVPANSFRSMFATIRVSDDTAREYQQIQYVATRDSDDNIYFSDHSNIFSGDSDLAAFSFDINNGNFRLLATPASSNSTLFQTTAKLIDK